MSTPNYYRARIQEALEFIDSQLSEKIVASDVAQAASFSEYHFHRLFHAFMGESIHQYVRSRRLEKAAQLLDADPTIRILDLAIEVGFETHSAFSRAFKQLYGVSPTKFDKSEYSPIRHRSSENNQSGGTGESAGFTPEIRDMPPLYFSYRIAKGTLSGRFFSDPSPEQQFEFILRHADENLIGFVSAFPASPQSLNDLSAQVWYGGLFTKVMPKLLEEHSFQFEGGKWAVFRYIGAYDYLHQAWSQIYRGWLPASGYALRDTLPFESYFNDPQVVSPEELLTEIWLPIE